MKIFISYRRDDSSGYAGRLFDHLSARFGSQHIFMDIDTIQPGEDFRKAIEKAVGMCDVVLVMIGRQWLNATDAQERRRLEDPGDWVRAEIATALANPRVRVIPVLVRDAAMPGADELPDDLKELAWRNAIELSDQRFQYDANKLIGVIEQLGMKPARPSPGIGAARLWGILTGIVAIGLIIWMLGSGVIPLAFLEAPTPTALHVPTSTATIPPATSSPTEEVIPTTENTFSPAIQTMDQYYRYINNAGIKEDLTRAWDLMTTSLQCNPSDRCNVENYKNYWWKLQVQYKLYDCGSNTVAAELIFYSRGSAPNPARKPEYVTYELTDDNGQLKLNSGTSATGISTYCELAVSVTVTPAPVILGIQMRTTGDAPDRIVFADINFRDEDGDAYLIKYELVNTTVSSGLRYEDDQITTSANRQMAGAILPVQWNCAGQGYTATFDVIILDKAGNQSNKFPVTFDCR